MIHTGNQTATIANGASLSGAIDLQNARLFALHMPADWTAANLTFSVSSNGTTYNDLYDSDGTEVTVTAAEDRYIVITNPSRWLGIRWLMVRSGTSGAAVNQGAERLITVVSVQ